MAHPALPPAPFQPSPGFLAWLEQLVRQPYFPPPFPVPDPDDD